MKLNRLIGSDEKFTLADKALNIILLFAIILGLSAFITDISMKLGPFHYGFTLFLTVLYIIFYYLAIRNPNYKRLAIPFLLLAIIPLVYTWYMQDGITGPFLMYWLIIIFIIPILSKGIVRIIILFTFFLIVSVLAIIEYLYPSIVTNYRNIYFEIVDLYLTGIFVAIAIIAILIVILHNYDKQKLSLEEVNKTKDNFFSIIAHDLRGPLGSLSQLGELIYEKQDNIDEQSRRELLESIHKSSKNTYNLLDNLLKWALSERGQLDSSPKELFISDIVKHNVELLKEKIELKNNRIVVDVCSDTLVYADENMLNTVIRNLISNANKFTPENGEIKVYTECRPEKSNLLLYISDTGVGIKKEVQDKLFNIESTYTTKGTNNESGTGLGLKLCYQFIKKNNGTIKVESEINKGTTFIVGIPRFIKNSG